MAYNQMLQSTIEGVKSIARTDLCLMDTEGNVIAATNEEAQQYKESVLTFVDSPAEIQVVQGYQYFKILDGTTVEYVMLFTQSANWLHFRYRTYCLLIKRSMTKRTLSRMYFWIICSWWIFIIRPRNSTLMLRKDGLYL